MTINDDAYEALRGGWHAMGTAMNDTARSIESFERCWLRMENAELATTVAEMAAENHRRRHDEGRRQCPER